MKYNRRIPFLMLCLSCGAAFAGPPAGDNPADPSPAGVAVPAASEAALQTGEPQFTLEAPAVEAGQEGRGYEAQLAEQAADLVGRAASASGDTAQRATALRAASFLLARSCEPPLSRLLQDIADPSDGTALARWADQSIALLKPIAAKSASPSESSAAPAMAEDGDFLLAVATACSAIGRSTSTAEPNKGALRAATPESDAVRQALLDAGSKIAPFLDDSRPAVAGLARLLQGVCYRRGGRPERAVEVLELMTDRAGQAPYELFVRLEHARALGDGGQLLAAMAMSIRWEATIPPRVPVEHRTAAAHAFRALRLRLMREWQARLETQNQPDAATLAKQHAERLRKSLSGAGPVALYRLGSVFSDSDEPPRVEPPVNR